VLAFLDELAAFAAPAQFPAHLLHALRGLVPCDSVSYNEIDLIKGRDRVVVDPADVVLPGQKLIFEHYLGEHPSIAYHHRSQDGTAIKLSDFLTKRAYHRLGLYGDYYRPRQVEHQLSIALPMETTVVGIALNRSRPDFSERDRDLLNGVRPHVVRALRNAEAFALLHNALRAHDCEPVFLTHDGRVVAATDRAWNWLSSAFDKSSRGSCRLPDEVDRWLRHQTHATALDDLPALPTPLTAGRPGAWLTIRWVPGAPAATGDLLILERIALTPPSAAVLAGLGLSPREAEVLAEAAQGRTNAEIGQRLAMAERTVEKHMAHIHTKLGVTTRTAAVALALAVPHNA
jgi:DNA-binding CsgD family transcriptional regulator